MSDRNIRVIIMVFLLVAFLTGCTNEPVLTTTSKNNEPSKLPDENPDEPLQIELEDNQAESDIPDDIRFTIQAEPDLLEPISALYTAYFAGETPVFVDDNPDLIASRSTVYNAEKPKINATFLPGYVLIPQNEKEDAEAFIKFAISSDGQEVLIRSGALPETLKITDQEGNEFEIHQPVRRVISAYGAATAFVYSVNGGDRLVAASYLGARDTLGAEFMQRIDPRFLDIEGDDYFSQQEFNLEHAAMLNPDLIIGAARSSWVESVEQLGIPVILFEIETPQQLRETILQIGQLFGPHSYAQAQAWIAYYDWATGAIEEQLSEIAPDEKPRILFSGTQPLRVASGDMYQTVIIEKAGGISVSSELSGYWNDVNMEQVAVWNPDIIIVPPYGGASVEAITESPEWQIIEAVLQNEVIRMPKLVVPWDTPAPDSVLGIVWMAERIHSEMIELGCETEAEFFYNTFYNYPISTDEIMAICK